jgi:hypothetical protein
MQLKLFSHIRRQRPGADAVAAYWCWRRESAAACAAYGTWARTAASGARSAFAAYQMALDREERAARVYARLVSHA